MVFQCLQTNKTLSAHKVTVLFVPVRFSSQENLQVTVTVHIRLTGHAMWEVVLSGDLHIIKKSADVTCIVSQAPQLILKTKLTDIRSFDVLLCLRLLSSLIRRISNPLSCHLVSCFSYTQTDRHSLHILCHSDWWLCTLLTSVMA